MPSAPPTQVGDSSWQGVDEYNDAEQVTLGFLSQGINTRVEKNQVVGRGGHVPVMWGQSSYSTTPTLLGNCYASIEYINPLTKREQFIIIGASNAWIGEVGGVITSVPYPSGETLTSTTLQQSTNSSGNIVVTTGTYVITSAPFLVQALGSVYLFRGEGISPMVFPDYSGNNNFALVNNDTSNPAPTSYLRMPWGKAAVWYNDYFAVLTDDALSPSEVENPEVYDPALAIPIEAGTNDVTTGVTVVNQTSATLLVTKTKSAHLIPNFTGDLSSVQVIKVPGSLGCITPKGFFNIASSAYLPTTEGIYDIKQIFQSQTQAESNEFSQGVYRSYRTANWSYFQNSVATFFEGLVYFAFPAGTSTVNNKVLVYSTITSAWVGVDTFDPKYAPIGFLQLYEGGKKTLFAVSATGLIYRYAYNLDNILDGLASDTTSAYPMIAKTRGYTTYYRTLYTSAYQHLPSPRAQFSQGQLRLETFNPNYTMTMLTSAPGKSIMIEDAGTRNRLNYTISGVPPWVPTNTNNDADEPYREDYSLCLGNSPFIIDNVNGNALFQYQEGRVNFTAVARGRYIQLELQNSTGQVRLLGLDTGIMVDTDVQGSSKESE